MSQNVKGMSPYVKRPGHHRRKCRRNCRGSAGFFATGVVIAAMDGSGHHCWPDPACARGDSVIGKSIAGIRTMPWNATSRGEIFVVDDDIATRGTLSRALVAAGYEVVCFADGAALLSQLRSHVPAC